MKPIEQLFAVDWDLVAQFDKPDDVQGWNSDHPLLGQLVEAYKPRVAIEVGSWKGRSAINLANALSRLDLDPAPRLYCVDTWMGGIDHLLSDLPQDRIERVNGYPSAHYCQFLWNVWRAGRHDIVQPVVAPSSIAARLFKAHRVEAGLIYIDADHTHDGCFADLVAYWDLLSPGGVIFGDDVHMPGVHSAVARFMDVKGLASVSIEGPFWVISKLHSDR